MNAIKEKKSASTNKKESVIVNITAIRKTIRRAKQKENTTGHLGKLLAVRVSETHRVIRLPKHNEINALFHFVNEYIDHVPNFILAVAKAAKKAGLEEDIYPFLALAEKYFLTPPDVLQGHVGLDELLDEAYLAHRLIEEVNDYYLVHMGAPLIPMDMTRANLIIHFLIGEPFANTLDETVHASVSRILRELTTSKDLPKKIQPTEPWAVGAHDWPCLSGTFGINLVLPQAAQTAH